ncbi:cbb3-type cytochrome oxidase subunit 3 [Gaopeijia maritima]|uniref:Cbb3-type cytochrome c oxidase subunit 3 n=1 Tax=Gaopeijia maritima TaxID=3119007 RepID=A0ABU9EF93_9BACT
MNTLTRTAAATVESGVLLGVMTALFLIFFIAWVVWAYTPSRKAQLDAHAQLPFTDGGSE